MSAVDTICAKLKSAPPAMVAEVLDLVEFLEARAKATALPAMPGTGWDAHFGRLKDQPIADDPAEAQRKLRDEWA